MECVKIWEIGKWLKVLEGVGDYVMLRGFWEVGNVDVNEDGAGVLLSKYTMEHQGKVVGFFITDKILRDLDYLLDYWNDDVEYAKLGLTVSKEEFLGERIYDPRFVVEEYLPRLDREKFPDNYIQLGGGWEYNPRRLTYINNQYVMALVYFYGTPDPYPAYLVPSYSIYQIGGYLRDLANLFIGKIGINTIGINTPIAYVMNETPSGVLTNQGNVSVVYRAFISVNTNNALDTVGVLNPRLIGRLSQTLANEISPLKFPNSPFVFDFNLLDFEISTSGGFYRRLLAYQIRPLMD